MTQNVAADRSGIDPIRGIRTSLSLSICTLLDGDGRCAPCSNCSIISRMWSGCWLQQQKADLTSVSLCSISIDLAAKRNYCVASLTIRQTGGDKRASLSAYHNCCPAAVLPPIYLYTCYRQRKPRYILLSISSLNTVDFLNSFTGRLVSKLLLK